MSAISFVGPVAETAHLLQLRRALDVPPESLPAARPPAAPAAPAVAPVRAVADAGAAGGGLDEYA